MSSSRKTSRLNLMLSTTAITTAIVIAAGSQAPAFAAQAPQTAEQAPIEEVVVTGSRIVREGYEAPTPLTVVGAEAFQQAADTNIVNFMNTMPALTGSQTNSSGANGLSPGTAGLQTLNLRSLGANRVLVLLDNERVVGASYQGLTDIASFPQQLISRVDVVTGGASAVYGSDAVAGVVNFVLDKKFTGVKGELSGGLTNYGDDKNYRAELSGGFGFAGDRGHVLLSGMHSHNAGITGDGGRQWNRTGFQQLANPAYTATNGLPQLLNTFNVGYSIATPGGIVQSGPLKGTAFGAGGTPFKFNYGSIVGTQYMVGGDWQYADERGIADLDGHVTNDTFFTRVAYDVTDNINVYAQYSYAQNKIWNLIVPNFVLSGFTVQRDNAFMPASVLTSMTTLGLTQLSIGTLNYDLPRFGNDNQRITNRVTVGLEGSANAFGTDWHFKTYYAVGATKLSVKNQDSTGATRFRQATDAVVNPANGQIVCRINIDAVTTNDDPGCHPWNPLGVGVNANNDAAYNWMNFYGVDFQRGTVKQDTFGATVSGEPLSLWAGPVSLAASFEHRYDRIHAVVDAASTAVLHTIGNFAGLDGAQSVSEGALETIIPLAKGESWADNWDFTAAVRFTGYELSGNVVTWKVGTTYTPIPDIKFRVTRSRDIRAPNLFELFSPPQSGIGAVVFDRFLPGQPQVNVPFSVNSGNTNLTPEKADTTGVGVVLQPAFLEGFSMSVDFWDVDISNAVFSLSVQQVMDTCYTGQLPSSCANIERLNGNVQRILRGPVNVASQDVRGLDFEASYRSALSDFVSDWRGNFSIHGLMTVYLRNYQNTTFSAPSNHVGENNDSQPPYWKLTATASYNLDPVTASLTARAVSGGRINSEAVECTSGCRASTTDHPTVSYNHMAGRFYLDANVVYKLEMGDTTGDLFFSVKNMFNNDPPPAVSQFYTSINTNTTLYDNLGTVFRAGLRFKM